MNDNDPLDLDDDGGVGPFEISILDEEEKIRRGGRGNKSGCCVVLFIMGSMFVTFWGLVKFIRV